MAADEFQILFVVMGSPKILPSHCLSPNREIASPLQEFAEKKKVKPEPSAQCCYPKSQSKLTVHQMVEHI